MSQYISIVIPVYNRAKIIPATLDSILEQSYQEWECLVVDDHSTDNTREVIENYCQRDSRFHYLVNEGKKGAQGARNTGLKHSQGDWIAFFDSDNQMKPQLLERLVLCQDGDSDVYTCFSSVIDVSTNIEIKTFEWICSGDISKDIFRGVTYVDYNGPIIRKSKLIEIGGLDEDCPSMQEWDTHIRLSKVARYYTIPEKLVDYYVGGVDAISSDTKREVIGRLYILRKYRREWKRYKESYIDFVKYIHELIYQNTDICFRFKTTFQLVMSAPYVQYICLKRKVKQIVRWKR